jgi:hypothetical protein
MKPGDAVITFHCFSPDLVQVIEVIGDERIHHQEVQRHPDVVTELEKKYMFFGEQANIGRKQIMRGQSCVFNVYIRQP